MEHVRRLHLLHQIQTPYTVFLLKYTCLYGSQSTGPPPIEGKSFKTRPSFESLLKLCVISQQAACIVRFVPSALKTYLDAGMIAHRNRDEAECSGAGCRSLVNIRNIHDSFTAVASSPVPRNF